MSVDRFRSVGRALTVSACLVMFVMPGARAQGLDEAGSGLMLTSPLLQTTQQRLHRHVSTDPYMAMIERSDPDRYLKEMASGGNQLSGTWRSTMARISMPGGMAAGGMAGVMPLAQLPLASVGGAMLTGGALVPGASLATGLNGTMLPPATIPGISGSNCTASLPGAALSLPALNPCP